MEKHTYEYLLRHTKLLLQWYFQGGNLRRHTKEAVVRRAAVEIVAMEQDLSNEEQRVLCNKLVNDILPEA